MTAYRPRSTWAAQPAQPHAFLTEQVGALSGVQAAETVLTLRRVRH
ncbi:hypothetical protein [Streptomyces tendae]